jgi:TM2 domain-containing membrane protein YozV
MTGYSPKSGVTTLLLCFSLGPLGAHRFYVGKMGTGILHLITLGGFGLWTLVDFVMIIVGKFTDTDGRTITVGQPVAAPSETRKAA